MDLSHTEAGGKHERAHRRADVVCAHATHAVVEETRRVREIAAEQEVLTYPLCEGCTFRVMQVRCVKDSDSVNVRILRFVRVRCVKDPDSVSVRVSRFMRVRRVKDHDDAKCISCEKCRKVCQEVLTFSSERGARSKFCR